MTTAHKFIYAKRFDGEPKLSDFELASETLPPLGENGLCSRLNSRNSQKMFLTVLRSTHAETLVKAEFLSVDPYMRVYMERYPVGTEMIGTQVARYANRVFNGYQQVLNSRF